MLAARSSGKRLDRSCASADVHSTIPGASGTNRAGMKNPLKLRLVDAYLVEGFSAMAAMLFLYGVYFWTQTRFGYSGAENLLLGSFQGLGYVLGARYGGRISDRLGYASMLRLCLAGTSLILAAGWIPTWHWTPFVVLPLFALLTGPIWPSLEASVLHAPGRLSTPKRLGLYNLVWSWSGALGLFLGGPLFALRPEAVLWVPSGILLALLGWSTWRLHGGQVEGSSAMEIPHLSDSVPRTTKYRFMLVGWWANAASYFLQAGLNALLPFLALRLAISPAAGIELASSLLFARAVSFFVFWKWEGWHYREWSNVLVCVALPLALAVVFWGPSVPVVLAGLLSLGFVAGLAYSMSIFYTLDYGETKGEHGGLHESVLGLGMLAGPLVGSVAAYAHGDATAAQAWLVGLGALLSIGGYVLVRGFGRRAPAPHS